MWSAEVEKPCSKAKHFKLKIFQPHFDMLINASTAHFQMNFTAFWITVTLKILFRVQVPYGLCGHTWELTGGAHVGG